jgi:hypothetical protein
MHYGGEAGGFRIVACLERLNQRITFLCIYPKTGAKGKGNENDEIVLYLFEVFVGESESEKLQEYSDCIWDYALSSAIQGNLDETIGE